MELITVFGLQGHSPEAWADDEVERLLLLWEGQDRNCTCIYSERLSVCCQCRQGLVGLLQELQPLEAGCAASTRSGGARHCQ